MLSHLKQQEHPSSVRLLVTVDLAKDVFQMAGLREQLKVVFNKQILRKDLLEFMAQQPPC